MSAVAHPLGLDPLIAEAKRRARQRRLIAAGVVVLAAGIAAAGLLSFSSGGDSSEVPWLPTKPQLPAANPPLAPACAASQLKASLFMQGASMSLVGGITIVNRGVRPCALAGRPKLSFAGAISKWRETPFHAQNVLPLQYDPLAPPAGSLRALAPGGHVQVNLWWSNWCGRGSTRGGDSGQPARAMVLSAPGGGRILLHNGLRRSFFAPVCNGGPGSASVLQATRFTPFVPQGPPSSALPFKAQIASGATLVVKGKHIAGPALVAKAGGWLSYTVVLTNDSGRAYRFGRTCPAYTEGIGAVQNQAYVLNCHALGSIGAGRSVRFAMRVRVPARSKLPFLALGWTLAPHTYHAPGALATIQLH